MSDKKRKRKRRSALLDGRPILFNTKKNPVSIFKRIFSSNWRMPTQISAIFVIAYIFVYSSNFSILLNPLDAFDNLIFSTTGGGVIDIRSDEVEVLKANIGIGIYISVFLYTLFFLKPVVKILFSLPHLIMIILLLLFGMRYSDNPQEVFFSVVQIGVGILIAIHYAEYVSKKDRWDRIFCFTILFPLFAVHFVSFFMFIFNNLDVFEFIDRSKRYGGLPGNPNVAGASAVIGLWSVLYLLLDRKNGILVDLYCVAGLFLFVFTIVVSGSATSLTVSLALVLVMIWLKFLSLFKDPKKKVTFVLSGILVLCLLVGYALISSSTENITETFTSSLGKESNFTGRAELWAIAIDAIIERPILGWSYDQHETVLGDKRFELPFGLAHFHNGFLDTAVAGGLLLLVAVIFNIYSYVKYYFKACVNDKHLSGIICPLIILILMNFSEYSLLRPLNVIFQFYLCAYFLILFTSMRENNVLKNSISANSDYKDSVKRKRRKKSAAGGVRYRF